MYIEETTEGVEGRAALFRVLAVYTLYNPQVSYCQGNVISVLAGLKKNERAESLHTKVVLQSDVDFCIIIS